MESALIPISLAFILCAAFGLSLLWGRVIPIFQSPDEQSHYDYSIGIAHAGRLLSTREGPLASIADPATAYLAAAVDLDRIAFHNDEAERPGYGTRADMLAIDAHVPRIDYQAALRGPHPIPFVVASYPFGFYALMALVASVASHFYGITGSFFAMRAACSTLFVIGLFFCYRALRELAMPPIAVLAIVATMGLLPLSSFVSSYIQPDNLAFTLCSALFFYALSLKRRALLRTVVVLGVLLGCLSITKLHLFVVMFVPVAGLVVVASVRSPRLKTRRIFAVLATLLPIIMFNAVQFGFVHPVGGEINKVALANMSVDGFLRAARVNGLSGAAGYYLSGMLGAASEFYGHSQTNDSFWGEFGWLDTSLMIGNASVELAIKRLLNIASYLTLFLTVVVIIRHCATVAIVMRGKRYESALALLFADPITMAYVLLTLALASIFAITGNGFGGQGRNWFPFLLPIVVTATYTAPSFFRQRTVRNAVRTLAIVVLFAYAGIASVYAEEDVQQRYYADNGQRLSRTTKAKIEGSSDVVGFFDVVRPTKGDTIKSSEAIDIRGWAVRPNALARAVSLEVDGNRSFPANYGAMREDVARTQDETYLYSGFHVVIPENVLRPGPHKLNLRVIGTDAAVYHRMANPTLLRITH